MERFWSKVATGSAAECWPWTGALHRGFGYGKFFFKGKNQYAHRIAYELSHGEIPTGLQVMHRCDFKPCVNPSHLSLGTAFDNMRDAAEKGLLGMAGTGNPNAQLTDDMVRDVRRRYAAGIKQVDICRALGLRKQRVWAITHGRAWTHVSS